MLVRRARRSLSVLLAAGLALLLSAGLTACTGEPTERPAGAPRRWRRPRRTPAATPSPTALPRPPQRPRPDAHRDALAYSYRHRRLADACRQDAVADADRGSHADRLHTADPLAYSHRHAVAYTNSNPGSAHHRRGPRHPRSRYGRGAGGGGPHARALRGGGGSAVGSRPVPARSGDGRAVEGWVRSLAGAARGGALGGQPWNVSDDHRRLTEQSLCELGGRTEILHDRQTGRTYAWDRSRIEFDQWWGTGPRRTAPLPARHLRCLRGDGRRTAARGAVHAPTGRALHQPQPAATSSSASASNVSRATASTS